VSSIDVMPTILEAVEIPLESAVDGTSLLPLRHRQDSSRDERLIHYQVLATEDAEDHHFVAASKGNFKILANPYDLRDGRHELYDLARDPGETTNVAGDRRELSREFLDAISDAIDESLDGMVVIEFSNLGASKPVEFRGVAEFNQPVRAFDLATRRRDDRLRSVGNSRAYEFQLTLGNEHRFLGLEPTDDRFELTLDLHDVPGRCRIAFGPERRSPDTQRTTYRRSDLLTNHPRHTGSGTRPKGCQAWIYYSGTQGGEAPPQFDRDQISDQDKEQVIEQMRALGYLE
jgi:hypothetical protein